MMYDERDATLADNYYKLLTEERFDLPLYGRWICYGHRLSRFEDCRMRGIEHPKVGHRLVYKGQGGMLLSDIRDGSEYMHIRLDNGQEYKLPMEQDYELTWIGPGYGPEVDEHGKPLVSQGHGERATESEVSPISKADGKLEAVAVPKGDHESAKEDVWSEEDVWSKADL